MLNCFSASVSTISVLQKKARGGISAGQHDSDGLWI